MSSIFRVKKKPGVLRKWSEADLLIAHQRAISGTPVKQIANEAGLNQTSIGRLLKRRFGYRPNRYHRPTLAIPEDVAVRAYIAGIVDGEGSIPFLNKHWCVKVGMTDEPVIRWLHRFGGHFEVAKRPEPRKQAYYWSVHRHHDVITLLTAIVPYMIVKRERAIQVLSEYSDKVSA